MKLIHSTFPVLLLLLISASCHEKVDTSTWKDDMKAMKPKKITAEKFEFFVREQGKEILYALRTNSEKQLVDSLAYLLKVTQFNENDQIKSKEDQPIVKMLFDSKEQLLREEITFEHYLDNDEELNYYTTFVKSEKLSVYKMIFSKKGVAFELGKERIE